MPNDSAIQCAITEYARWDLFFDISTGEGYLFRTNDDGTITKFGNYSYSDPKAQDARHTHALTAATKAALAYARN